MDAIDATVCALLALMDLTLLFYMRWRRGYGRRVERRICRSLRLALSHSAAQ
jgi:hypothetical protein